MKYVSIDVETGGLDSDEHSLLSIGMVLDDLCGATGPATRIVLMHEVMALSLWSAVNLQPLLQEMEHVEKQKWWKDIVDSDCTYGFVRANEPESVSKFDTYYVEAEHVQAAFEHAIWERLAWPRSESVVVAGKNFAMFDRPFLADYGCFLGNVKLSHRVLDPAILCWEAGDTKPPNLDICLKRCGMTRTDAHSEVGDALDVARVLRAQLAAGPSGAGEEIYSSNRPSGLD